MEYSERTKEYIAIIEKQLTQDGVLEDADKENLKFLADAVELYQRGLEELDNSGLIVTDTKGRVVASPAFSIVRSSQSTITALMKELSISLRQRRMLKKDNMVDEQTPIYQLFDIIDEQ